MAENPNDILLEEARAGRVAGLESALDEFGSAADVNRALDHSFLSPLCLACRGGHEEAALFLLRRADADPNNAVGEKAAAAAPAAQGYYGNGADGDEFIGGSSGGIGGIRAPSTPLALAVDSGLQVVVEELLARGARVDARRSGDAWTPLHLCAARGNALMMKVLLAAPLADAGARTSRQETPLSVASFHGHLSVVDMLLEGVVDDDDEKPAEVGGIKKETTGSGSLGTSAVLVATEDDAAAGVVGDNNGSGSSRGRDGSRRHAEERTWAGRTPLHRAAAQGHTEVVLRLLAHGVDGGPTDSHGATPLHLSAGRGHWGAARALVREGKASTLAATEEGDTVLHAAAGSAAASGRTTGRVVHLLLISGAKVDARNRLGSTGTTDRQTHYVSGGVDVVANVVWTGN